MTIKLDAKYVNNTLKTDKIEPQSGTTLTVGASGDTIALASGATATGFGRTGAVDWQTRCKKTSDFHGSYNRGIILLIPRSQEQCYSYFTLFTISRSYRRF